MYNTLEEYVESISKLPPVEIIKEMKKISDLLDEVKSRKTALEKMHDAIRLKILPDKMEEEDISNMSIEGVGRVCLQSDIYFSIPKDNAPDAYDWMRNNGHGDLIIETVNASSAKAWAKECIKQGITLPSDIFKVTPFTRAQLTKFKG